MMGGSPHAANPQFYGHPCELFRFRASCTRANHLIPVLRPPGCFSALTDRRCPPSLTLVMARDPS